MNEKVYIVSYDLRLPETRLDYQRLIQHIKSSYSFWAKPLKSVWLIRTEKGIAEVRDELRGFLDSNDQLVILDVTGADWATYGITAEVTTWMRQNISE